MLTPFVIKLGGALVEDTTACVALCQMLTRYRCTTNRPLIVVHGGGGAVDNLLTRLNLPVQKIDGLRVTPTSQIDLIVGVLAGSVNKTLLACAKRARLPAVGLCLADGDSLNVTPLHKHAGCVGYAEAGDPALLNRLLAAGYLPIVSSIGMTATGELMNVNADQAATALAKMFKATLLMLTDTPGVLDEKQRCLATLNARQIDQLTTCGVLTGGMKVKTQAALEAAAALGRPVIITSGTDIQQLWRILHGAPGGTQVISADASATNE